MISRFKSYLIQGYDTILLREWRELGGNLRDFPISEESASLFSELFSLFLVVGDWSSYQILIDWFVQYASSLGSEQWQVEGPLAEAMMHLYLNDMRKVRTILDDLEGIIEHRGTVTQHVRYLFVNLIFFLNLSELTKANELLVHLSHLLRDQSTTTEMQNWFTLAQIKVAIESGNISEAYSLFTSSFPEVDRDPRDWMKFFWLETQLQLLLMAKSRELDVIAHANEIIRIADLKDYRLLLKRAYEALMIAHLRLKNETDALRSFQEYERLMFSRDGILPSRGWIMEKKYYEILFQSEKVTDAFFRESLSLARELNHERYFLLLASRMAGWYLYHRNQLGEAKKTIVILEEESKNWISEMLKTRSLFLKAMFSLLIPDIQAALEELMTIREKALYLRDYNLVFRAITFSCLINWMQNDSLSLKKNINELMDLAPRITDLNLKSWSWSIIIYILSTMKKMNDAEKPTSDLEYMASSLVPAPTGVDDFDVGKIQRDAWLSKAIFLLNQMAFDNLDQILKNNMNPWLQTLDSTEVEKYLRHWFLFKVVALRREIIYALILSKPDILPSISEKIRGLRDNKLVSRFVVLSLMLESILSLIDLFNGKIAEYQGKRRSIIEQSTHVPMIVQEDRLAELFLTPSEFNAVPREREEKIAVIQEIDKYLELLYGLAELYFSADDILRAELFS